MKLLVFGVVVAGCAVLLAAQLGRAFWEETPTGIKPSADMARTDIPEEYRWDLGALFPSVDEWNKAYEEVISRIPTVAMCRGDLGKSAGETRQCLDNYAGLRLQIDELSAYAFQYWTVDMLDSGAQEIKEKSIALGASLEEAASFIDPELQAIPTSTWEEFLKQDKGLQPYDFPYRDLKRRGEHLLSPREESLMAQTIPMREGPYSAMNALGQEMDFPDLIDESGLSAELNFASFPRYRGSKDREVRKQAVTGFFSTLEKHSNSLAALLGTSVKGAVFEARARGYTSSLELALDADNVPVAMYKNLIDTTAENLPRTLHRYVELRKKILGLEDIHYYDMYNPLFPAVSHPMQYDEALNLLEASLAPMGQDYVSILRQGMQPGSGWADVFPNKGKKGGAYCNAAYGTHPFVFLNYMNELDDAFTATHEFGHAMHFYLASQAQPYPTADAPIFLAEIASTFHEELLLSHLLSSAESKDVRLKLLNKRVENIRLTIIRQIMFAEFEMLMHGEMESGGAITAEKLNSIYEGLVKKYFGPSFTVDPLDKFEWAYIPHFYYNFYVYKYSTGLMSAIVFARRILDEKPGAETQYKGLLAAGGSDYAPTILERAGVDFTNPEIVQSTYALFAQTLNEMEELLK